MASYQRLHPMTVFCKGIRRIGERHARTKEVSGPGRWYYTPRSRRFPGVLRAGLAGGGARSNDDTRIRRNPGKSARDRAAVLRRGRAEQAPEQARHMALVREA